MIRDFLEGINSFLAQEKARSVCESKKLLLLGPILKGTKSDILIRTFPRKQLFEKQLHLLPIHPHGKYGAKNTGDQYLQDVIKGTKVKVCIGILCKNQANHRRKKQSENNFFIDQLAAPDSSKSKNSLYFVPSLKHRQGKYIRGYG